MIYNSPPKRFRPFLDIPYWGRSGATRHSLCGDSGKVDVLANSTQLGQARTPEIYQNFGLIHPFATPYVVIASIRRLPIHSYVIRFVPYPVGYIWFSIGQTF